MEISLNFHIASEETFIQVNLVTLRQNNESLWYLSHEQFSPSTSSLSHQLMETPPQVGVVKKVLFLSSSSQSRDMISFSSPPTLSFRG